MKWTVFFRAEAYVLSLISLEGLLPQGKQEVDLGVSDLEIKFILHRWM